MVLNHTSEALEEVLLEEQLTDVGNQSQLVVHNDEVNTFDWVIKCFTEILQHTAEQAEQCSLIIHFKGKAIVKTAPLKELRPLKDGLTDRGLSAVIESCTD